MKSKTIIMILAYWYDTMQPIPKYICLNKT